MQQVFLSVFPVFGLILFGHVLFRMNFPAREFWPASERLTYYALFPAMLVSGLVGRHFESGTVTLALCVGGALALTAGIMMVLRSRFGLSGPVFTSVFQGSIRPNTYVALSLAAALLGPQWMRLAAVALLVSIPLVNVLCVLVLAWHGNNGPPGAGGVLRQLATNPLILACLFGMSLNGMDIRLPAMVQSFLEILGRAALPMGLLAVGAGLRPAATSGHFRAAIISSAAHLVMLPVLAMSLCLVLGGDAQTMRAAIIFTAIPVAASSFILARQMGGDHEAMAAVITVQTALSVVSLSFILALVA